MVQSGRGPGTDNICMHDLHVVPVRKWLQCVVRQGSERAEMISSFQSQNTLLSVQKRHPYTGNLNSETPGTVKQRFYNWDMFQDHMT